MARASHLYLVAFTLVVLSISTGVVVDARKIVPPAPKPPFPFIKCPANPLDKCDFYLSLYKSKIPTFTIGTISSDKILSSATLTSGKGGLKVITASTSGLCYFIPETAKTGKCGASFYFRGKTLKKGKWDTKKANYVAARTIVNTNLAKYKNKCVALPVTTATIQTVPARGKIPAQLIYLNPNTYLNDYPKARRCVIFKTTA